MINLDNIINILVFQSIKMTPYLTLSKKQLHNKSYKTYS